uniref:RNA-directed DNA polymerase n=1 Tax=Bos mutus grunniens TaxID=30521 RepID=A0A8B9WAY0_BOSMU
MRNLNACQEATMIITMINEDNHNGVITHLEPDILECEVKWALGSITMNKASGGDGIPVELFQILKDDAMKVLHSIVSKFGKLSSGHRTGKGQEATVRTGHGTTDWFQIGKGVCQGCILSPCLFNLYAEYIMRKAGLEEAQAGIKIAGRNINKLRYADDTTLMAESEEELNSFLMKVKVESEKVGLKLNIQKTKIMASWSHHFMGNRWGNSGNSVRLYFFGLQNHCRW